MLTRQASAVDVAALTDTITAPTARQQAPQ